MSAGNLDNLTGDPARGVAQEKQHGGRDVSGGADAPHGMLGISRAANSSSIQPVCTGPGTMALIVIPGTELDSRCPRDRLQCCLARAVKDLARERAGRVGTDIDDPAGRLAAPRQLLKKEGHEQSGGSEIDIVVSSIPCQSASRGRVRQLAGGRIVDDPIKRADRRLRFGDQFPDLRFLRKVRRYRGRVSTCLPNRGDHGGGGSRAKCQCDCTADAGVRARHEMATFKRRDFGRGATWSLRPSAMNCRKLMRD